MMRMMSPGGHLLTDYTLKVTVRRWKEIGDEVVKNFKYKLLFDWIFCYHHSVDYNNNLSHALTPIEDTWMNNWWECRIFSIILAISEVHEFLILLYFVYCGLRWEGMPILPEFCWKLVWQLSNNI